VVWQRTRATISRINDIIEKCVVEEPEQCLNSAQELLIIVDENLGVLEQSINWSLDI
jgi:hypothetical protein